ncbi:hypothetical protein ACOME3_009724 [Neoechinorhynchus agilis]
MKTHLTTCILELMMNPTSLFEIIVASTVIAESRAMVSKRVKNELSLGYKLGKSLKTPQLVWVPHIASAFTLAQIDDILTDTIKVRLLDTKDLREFPYDHVYAAEPSSQHLPDDNCALMYLNPATLLENTRARYAQDAIYTYVANILIAVNPYKPIESNYTKDLMHSYQNQSLQTRPPHVFAIGDKAYREMKQIQKNQSIVVSGESGSGKTESVKFILKYLTECYGQQAGLIEERILNSNPLLEAFGNAKTIKNNNSSRFGKFIELHFQRRRAGGTKYMTFDISGGFISHYLLERSRVCMQPQYERNYHIFYQLCARANDELYKQLALDTPDRFSILSKGRCTSYFSSPSSVVQIKTSRQSAQHLKDGPLHDIQLDDALGFDQCIDAMKHIGISDQRINEVLALVAAVMHLGNIDFIEDGDDKASSGGCVVNFDLEKRAKSLFTSARLLGIPMDDLERDLVHRTMVTRHTRRDSLILVPLNVSAAKHARDGLCKALYVKLFEYLVTAINKSIPVGYNGGDGVEAPNGNNLYIGILDIAGFEYMPVNSFEQFCINYCNEKLQQFFNGRILRDEQNLYEHEGLGVPRIQYVDNQDCIDLIEARRNGILSLLDEESRLPSPDHQHFTQEVFRKNKGHQRLDLSRKSPLKLYREILDTEGFMIRHFAGAVVYSTRDFIDKNNDSIHTSLLETLAKVPETTDGITCSNLLKDILGTSELPDEQVGKLSFLSVGSKFKTQLSDLLDRLETTGTSFVRCIKPNELMKPMIFDGPHILSQLQCAGMLSVLELMQQGYPSRAKFDHLYSKYRSILPADLARLEPRFFCKALFHSLNMRDGDFRFGLTRVFFRAGKFAEFDAIMTNEADDPESRKRMDHLVERARKWIGRARWKKAQYTVMCAMIIRKRIQYRRERINALQSALRQWIVYRRHEPIIAALCRIKIMKDRSRVCLAELANVTALDGGGANHLATKCEEIMKRCEEIKAAKLNNGYFKDNLPMDFSMLNAELCTLETDVEQVISDSYKWAELQKQKQQEEKLRALQRELETENAMREKENKERQEREREAQQRDFIEQRRLHEAKKIIQSRANGTNGGGIAENGKKFTDTGIQAMFDDQQTRLDHDLASKLAAMTGSSLDPLTIIGLTNAHKAVDSKKAINV